MQSVDGRIVTGNEKIDLRRAVEILKEEFNMEFLPSLMERYG